MSSLARSLGAAVAVGALLGATSCGREAARPLAGGSVAPASCATCHAAIATEWRASFHRAAFTDATFQRSLALEEPADRPFCVRCHAPAASRAGAAEGIDCVTCHASPHEHRAARACESCHEFTFDGGRKELVQKTASEHAASSKAGVSCATCHLPGRAGHSDHRFLGGHDVGWLARGLSVSGARSGPRTLTVSIRVDAGHAFPTGDMFRRARLLVFAEGEGGQIVADAERVFGREWGGLPPGEHTSARTELRDTRIRERWSEAFAWGDVSAPIARVRWSLLYERAVAVRGAEVSLVSSDELASGELAW